MLNSVTGTHKSKRGFTLLELLVVLVIIGITATFAVLSTGDFGHKRKIRLQAEQILETLHYAQYYAILRPAIVRMHLAKSEIEWQSFDPNRQKWFEISQDKILAPHKRYHFVEMLSPQITPVHPWITVSPTGHIQPFEMRVKDARGTAAFRIKIDNENVFSIDELS